MSTWTGPWPRSAATWRPTRSTTGRSACSRSWTTARSSGWLTGCWNTTRREQDVREFFSQFKVHLDARGLKVLGITTDGSSLYPEVVQEVFPGARHQICQFHVLKDIIEAVLHAVAKVRKELKAKQPALPRGRPSKANQALTREAAEISGIPYVTDIDQAEAARILDG